MTYHRRVAPTSLLARGALAAAVLLLAGACGDDEPESAEDPGTDTSTSPSAEATGDATGPACDEIWVDGAQLPRNYRGCVAEGAEVKPEKTTCSSGQIFVTYDDRFWAVTGGTISEGTSPLVDDPDYAEDIGACTA